ncbi:hypothetical protein [Sorangium sp. So ce1153]|uniref:hypothetical protein n=1 Tax=Sorangium sp. So ce1153 TaxID=3133333 RepID=UPI003F60C97D
MKRLHVMALLGAAALGITSSAWAGTWYDSAAIDTIDTVPGIGYRIYTTTGNPADCANTGRLDPISTITAAERQLMDKTILSAFLAGRKVQVNVSNSICTADGYPTYVWVRLSKNE